MSKNHHRNALPQGFKLHWYSIDRVLGQGGFGITYLARDHNLEQDVALKEYVPSEIIVRAEDLSLQPRSADDAEQYKWGLDRFLSEARTLAKFVHPNIVQVFSVFEANHTAYMVMRYEQGESLRATLKQRKHLSEEELLRVALPILDGLERIHAAGFIHRDIQPPNIYIREDASPVLLDFGAARKTMGGPRTLTILVAPGYAPIEQYYSNSAEQGPWTDIYGMGATLYRAVSGVAPIDAIERSRGMLGSTKDMLVPAKVVGQGRYSETFLAAIDHALMFSDRERPQSAAALAAELQGQAAPAPPKRPASAPTARAQLNPVPIVDPHAESESVTQYSSQLPAMTATGRHAVAVALILAAGIGFGVWLAQTREPGPDAASGKAPAAPAVAAREEGIHFDPDRVMADSTGESPVAADASGSAGGSPGNLLAGESGAAVETPVPAPAESQPAVTAKQEVPQSASTAETAAVKMQSDADPGREAALEAELTRLKAERDSERKRMLELQAARPKEQPLAAAAPAPSGDSVAADAPGAVKGTVTPLQAGLDAFSAADYAAALRLLKPIASDGNRLAQYHVAMMYRSGRGVLANNAMALDWMHKAAWQGEPEAQLALARMYLEGVDGVHDQFLAYTWFLVAERNGTRAEPVERREAESALQPEQLLQASTLAARLEQAPLPKPGSQEPTR